MALTRADNRIAKNNKVIRQGGTALGQLPCAPGEKCKIPVAEKIKDNFKVFAACIKIFNTGRVFIK